MANDVDEKRCHLLVHQTKRLNSPCVVITRFAAQMFPTLKYTVTEDGVEKEKRSGFLFKLLKEHCCLNILHYFAVVSFYSLVCMLLLCGVYSHEF